MSEIDEPVDETDAPLDEDEMLLQQYLDGTLSEQDAATFELRLDRSPELAAHVAAYGNLLSALDGMSSPSESGSLVAGALASWKVDAPLGIAWSQVFGGIGPAMAAFVVLDVGLAGLLTALLITRGPVEILKAWALGLKEVIVWFAVHVPSAQTTAVLVPTLMVLAIALLGGVGFTLRSVLDRAEVQS
jgi:hypothetical protein